MIITRDKQREQKNEKKRESHSGERTNCLARTNTDVDDVLCHECIVHGDDVYLVDALRLEFIVLLDVSWHLQAARGRESPRHADLCLYVFVRMFSCERRKKKLDGSSSDAYTQFAFKEKGQSRGRREGKERCADVDSK